MLGGLKNRMNAMFHQPFVLNICNTYVEVPGAQGNPSSNNQACMNKRSGGQVNVLIVRPAQP